MGGFGSHILRSSHKILNTGWRVWSILLLRSDNCFLTASADFWSLKGKTTRWTVFSLVDWDCTSGFLDRTEVAKWQIVDWMRLSGYLKLVNITLRWSHSDLKDSQVGDSWNAWLTWSWEAISCTFYRHGFGGEVGQCSLVSDKHLLSSLHPFLSTSIPIKGTLLSDASSSSGGPLLHHQSHVDKRYKKSLLKTMLNRTFHPMLMLFIVKIIFFRTWVWFDFIAIGVLNILR